MDMPKALKINFVDTYENAKLFFIDTLSKRYEVVLDENPDYLFFGDRNFGAKHLSPQFVNCKKIFFTGENVRPYWSEADYGISFDQENSPRHYRLPLYVLEMWAITRDNNPGGIFTYDWLVNKPYRSLPEGAEQKLAYIQSNPNCGPRNEIVSKFLQNGKLISGGPHMNTVGYVVPRDRSLKFDFYRKCMFGAAMENGSYPGYVTEKLIDCYYAGVVPVYWGSPTITRDFHPSSFIQATTPQETYDKVMSLSKKEAEDIINNHPFPNGLPDVAQLDNFLDWFERWVR